jgi:CPA2 family monovalent cation:H+ antiporter-2
MEIEILKGIVIIFALSTFVNLIFTKLKIPTVIGYLLTGIIAGPNMLALAGNQQEIEALAEIGVVLLLFTIGLEFSLQHLLKIRRIVLFGGFFQVIITAAIFFGVSQLYGMGTRSGFFMGFLIALSSSALVMKLLQERSEITSNYGRTVLGILIFQDLLLVPLMLFTNLLGNNTVDAGREIFILLIKVIFVIGLVYAGNKWVMPKLLDIITLAKNQELFIMSIILVCFGIALLTSSLGMSLAFGAFLAGLMISGSEYSHNVFGNFLPIKDIFTSFFFVSIGMLLNVSFVIDNILLILISVVLVTGLKTIVAGATGFILGHTLKGTLLIGLSLSQVGEFSFILAKMGFDYSIIGNFHYQLFLAVAVITIAITPFLLRMSPQIFRLLMKMHLPGYVINGLFPLKEMHIPSVKNHIIIIGKDASALKLSSIASENGIKHISVIFDPVIAKEKMNNGDLVVYGDAINEPVLRKAHIDTADIVIISVGSVVPCLAIIQKVRQINNQSYIIVRSPLIKHISQLYNAGADQVIPEKFEIAIDLLNRILLRRTIPRNEISKIMTNARVSSLGVFMSKERTNYSALDDFTDIRMSQIIVSEGSPADGRSLVELDLRKNTGLTLLAIRRGESMIEHPAADTTFVKNDIAYVIGNNDQVEKAGRLVFGKS